MLRLRVVCTRCPYPATLHAGLEAAATAAAWPGLRLRLPSHTVTEMSLTFVNRIVAETNRSGRPQAGVGRKSDEAVDGKQQEEVNASQVAEARLCCTV